MLVLVLSGCRSAEDAFLDAQNAERAGNNKLAVRYYLETIRLNPNMPQAKQRLGVVAQQELDSGIRRAESLIRNGDGNQGLAQLDATKALHNQVKFHAPGVRLPQNFNHLKDQAQTQVRGDLFRQAKAAEQRKEWDKALALLSDLERYNPSSKDRMKILGDRDRINDKAFKDQLSGAEELFKQGKYPESLGALDAAAKYADKLDKENLLKSKKSKFRTDIIISEATALKANMDKKRFIEAADRLKGLDNLKQFFEKPQLDAIRVLNTKLYNSWADDLFKAGKFRESWHRAGDALKFENSNQEALDIQRKALQLGRVNFVLLPIIHNKKDAPFIKKIDTDFNNGPARNMPPFTLLVSDFDLRDAFRAFRVNPQNITREQALNVARRTNASFVIFRELTAYRMEEQFVSSRTIPVKKKDNTPSTMEVKKGVIKLNSRLLVTIVDAKSGHRIFSKEGDISSKLEFEQGFLKEPIKNLALTNEQRSLLEPPAQQDFETAEKASVKTATDFFLKTIFPEMEKVVP